MKTYYVKVYSNYVYRIIFCVDKTYEIKQLLVDIQFMFTELSLSPLYDLISHAIFLLIGQHSIISEEQ